MTDDHGSLEDEASAALFAFYGLELPQHRAPALDGRIHNWLGSIGRRLLLISSVSSVIGQDACQLELPFVRRLAPISGMAPTYAHPYLDYGVFDCFRDEEALRRPALAIEARGILVLGQLTQLDYGHMARMLSDTTATRMREQLRSLGLDFGLRLPRWQRVNAYLSA